MQKRERMQQTFGSHVDPEKVIFWIQFMLHKSLDPLLVACYLIPCSHSSSSSLLVLCRNSERLSRWWKENDDLGVGRTIHVWLMFTLHDAVLGTEWRWKKRKEEQFVASDPRVKGEYVSVFACEFTSCGLLWCSHRRRKIGDREGRKEKN